MGANSSFSKIVVPANTFSLLANLGVSVIVNYKDTSRNLHTALAAKELRISVDFK